MGCVSRYLIFTEKKCKNIQKTAENTLTATKTGYFAQFGIFGDIDGSRKSQKSETNLFILLLLSIVEF